MDILFVSTELAPYAKTGGLADVSASLVKALRQSGHSVTAVLPRYRSLEEQGLLLGRRLTPLRFRLGEVEHEVTVYDGRLPSQVELVVLDVPGFFESKHLYGEPGEDPMHLATRFATFARAAAEVVVQRAESGRAFDVVHGHDWPCALVPTMLEAVLGTEGRKKTVLTVHNASHQGIFPKETLLACGLTWDHFRAESAEFYGSVNWLKLGVLTAGAVTTVSETYAQDLKTPEGGHRLHGVFGTRGVTGILNGVDYAVWNPATDPHLPARFDAEDRSGKVRCKGALLHELGFALETDKVLLGFVGRLAPQKGIDVLAASLPLLLQSTSANFVFAGGGDEGLKQDLEKAAAAWPERVRVLGQAEEGLVHRLFASADALLVPSEFEPCGLVQMYAQRYGAAPVARRTGGLADTIVDADAHLETGTGFLFDEGTPQALVGAALRAVAATKHPAWGNFTRRMMRLDRGWERAVRRYEQVYRSL